jgi:4-hydroxybenzoate polyprenyltransferase
MSTPLATPTEFSPLLAWLRLLRAPNVFTAIADIAMGYLVVHGSYEPWGLFACLAVASAFLYTAGMVLNDVFDFDIDAQERPFRPLPARQISLSLARTIGIALLLSGIVFGGLAGLAYAPPSVGWRSGAIAVLLSGSILLYDGWLKRLAIGPLGMGLCRFFNVLLGMSIAPSAAGYLLGFDARHLLPAAGIGTYIVGVTIFAKGEAGHSSIRTLIAGMAVMITGVALLGWAGNYIGRDGLSLQTYWLLLAVLLAVLLRRCLAALFDPSPVNVQAGVKNGIVSLILFDAAVALAAADPIYSLGIVLLLAPMLILGRWVYST